MFTREPCVYVNVLVRPCSIRALHHRASMSRATQRRQHNAFWLDSKTDGFESRLAALGCEAIAVEAVNAKRRSGYRVLKFPRDLFKAFRKSRLAPYDLRCFWEQKWCVLTNVCFIDVMEHLFFEIVNSICSQRVRKKISSRPSIFKKTESPSAWE